MNKRKSRIIAFAMLVIGVCFIAVALNNPQLSWPWSNTITYFLYFVYLLGMAVLFIAPFKEKK
ncbi:hypothetical protein [Anaerostipes caccae]|uniref:hypothetical protein n=1 Tax=Anaerostipes caccae TaxID=105841 RepID=UPI00267263D4|nr:hypothetical protein [Anaerostipes caccae]